MGIDAMRLLVNRTARSNNLYIFAWVAALGLPWGMQLLAGSNDDVQSFMAGYYGSLSLFMFFGLTFGFSTVFVTFYIASSLRRAGTLDMLRVSGITPREVVLGYFWQLQWILVPPALGFMLVFAVYAALSSSSREVWTFGWQAIVGGAVSFLLSQAGLTALMGVMLFRREYLWSLLLLLLVLPVNFTPVILAYVLQLPMALVLLIYISLVAAALALAVRNVARLWPPSRNPIPQD